MIFNTLYVCTNLLIHFNTHTSNYSFKPDSKSMKYEARILSNIIKLLASATRCDFKVIFTNGEKYAVCIIIAVHFARCRHSITDRGTNRSALTLKYISPPFDKSYYFRLSLS